MGEEIVNSLLKEDVELYVDPIIKKDFPDLQLQLMNTLKQNFMI